MVAASFIDGVPRENHRPAVSHGQNDKHVKQAKMFFYNTDNFWAG